IGGRLACLRAIDSCVLRRREQLPTLPAWHEGIEQVRRGVPSAYSRSERPLQRGVSAGVGATGRAEHLPGGVLLGRILAFQKAAAPLAGLDRDYVVRLALCPGRPPGSDDPQRLGYDCSGFRV